MTELLFWYTSFAGKDDNDTHAHIQITPGGRFVDRAAMALHNMLWVWYTVIPQYNEQYRDRGLLLYQKICYNWGSVISDGNPMPSLWWIFICYSKGLSIISDENNQHHHYNGWNFGYNGWKSVIVRAFQSYFLSISISKTWYIEGLLYLPLVILCIYSYILEVSDYAAYVWWQVYIWLTLHLMFYLMIIFSMYVCIYECICMRHNHEIQMITY